MPCSQGAYQVRSGASAEFHGTVPSPPSPARKSMPRRVAITASPSPNTVSQASCGGRIWSTVLPVPAT
ncbi:hypothetical protein [Methylibium sp. T29-B]|uniref:hypothetical protein n=1 Tax=Methylibium sp. T29-B TaxID=1437443 RepID=UPI00056851E7|nr:hypothetical protein [Methylibium sp. T29-B]